MAIARYGTQASVHYTRHMSLFHTDIVSSSEIITVVKITLVVVPISRLLQDFLGFPFLLATTNLEKPQISMPNQLDQVLKVCILDKGPHAVKLQWLKSTQQKKYFK